VPLRKVLRFITVTAFSLGKIKLGEIIKSRCRV
jgi:hypothetical protein